MPYSILFDENATRGLQELDKPVQEQIAKKLKQLERDDFKSRHLKHGFPIFVEEVGQYRIAFKTREDAKEKRVYFIGNHRDYEKWFKTL